MAEKGKPGRTARIRFRPVVNAQQTANDILVDLDAESQRDLLSDAGTTPGGIATFHGNDGVDEVFPRPLRSRPTSVFGRKQHPVLSFPEHAVEMQQSMEPKRAVRNREGLCLT